MVKPLISLANSGAGTLGVLEAGAYKAIFEYFDIEEVAGTSAGSILSALIALGYTPSEVIDIVLDGDFSKLIDYSIPYMMISLVDNKDSLFSLSSNKNVLSWLSNLTQNKVLKDTLIPFKAITTDLYTGTYQVWDSKNPDHENMLIKDAVYSSMAIPFVFPAYQGRYVDGGAVRNIPVQFLTGKNKLGVAIAERTGSGQTKNFFESVSSLLSILLSDDDKLIEDWAKVTQIPIIKLPSSGARFLERNMPMSQKEELVQIGYETAKHFINENMSKICPTIKKTTKRH